MGWQAECLPTMVIKYKRKKDDQRAVPTLKDDLIKRLAEVMKFVWCKEVEFD